MKKKRHGGWFAEGMSKELRNKSIREEEERVRADQREKRCRRRTAEYSLLGHKGEIYSTHTQKHFYTHTHR